MSVSVDLIKKLREETGAGIADCREALSSSGSDIQKAKEYLQKKGLDKADSKADREVKAGVVEAYSHGGRLGVLIEVLCETDFVAKTDDFKKLAHELALQVASMGPETTQDLLAQEYIRDSSQTVESLIKSSVARLGENIQVGKFSRIELGKSKLVKS